MSKQKPEPKARPEPKAQSVQPTTETPVPTADLIARLRAAKSVEDAVTILAPDAKPRPRADALYAVVEGCTEPLPQRRGACLKVYAVAARLNRPFKVEDVTAALPEAKSAAYWTRRLVKTGHLVEVG